MDAKRVVTYLQSEPEWFGAALDALEQWNEPDLIDMVVGRYRELPKRDPEILKSALSPALDGLLTATNPEISSRCMTLATRLQIPLSEHVLITIVESKTSPVLLKQ